MDSLGRRDRAREWLLRLDSEPLAPSDARRGASRWTAWGDETERSEGMARRTGRFPQLGGAGPGGPRNGNENRWDWTECGAGSGEVEINHGAIEAEQLCDPERA